MENNFNYKSKYFKYKMKYFELKKNMIGGEYNYDNFNLIKLDSLNKYDILTNSSLNLRKEMKLIYLIHLFLLHILQNRKNNELAEQIKNELFEITKLNDIKCMNVCEFIDKVFGDINNKSNIKKQFSLFSFDYKNNIYGFNNIDKDDLFMRNGGINNSDMFLDCLYKNLDANSYIVYYIDKNYKMIMMVNNSNFDQLNPYPNVSEHIFIHKLPSTELIEKIYGKKNFDMAIKLHKYAIQKLKPNYVVSAPLTIMKPIFKKLCDEQILVEMSTEHMLNFFYHAKKNEVSFDSTG